MVKHKSRSGIIKCTKRDGFTLIEALLTVAVMAVGLVMILSSFNAAARSNLSMQEYDNVCALAFKVCEELNSSPDLTFNEGNNGETSHAGYPGYYTTLDASPHILFSYGNYKAVKYYDIIITVTTPSYNRYNFKTCKLVR